MIEYFSFYEDVSIKHLFLTYLLEKKTNIFFHFGLYSEIMKYVVNYNFTFYYYFGFPVRAFNILIMLQMMASLPKQ